MSQPAPPSYDARPAPPTPPSGRRPVVIALVAAFAVLALAVIVPVLAQRLRAGQEAAVAADLSEVRTYSHLPRVHTEDDVDYAQVPPVGGRHDPEWLDCGVYDAPVRDENAVHDLEHGSVWITYRPGLDAAGVETLTQALPQNGILSPYGRLPAPVVVTVWGRQLRLTGAHDPRLALFIARFGGGETAPEPFASCAGGVREPSRGASDGTSV